MIYRDLLIPLGVLLALGGLACAQSARIAPPVEAGAKEQRRFAMAWGDTTRVSVLVEDRPWSSSTSRLLTQHTTLFVAVQNRGSHTLRYRTEDIVLHIADEEYEAIPLDRILADSDPGMQEARLAKTEGMRGATLEPGDRADGFVFFRKKISDDEPFAKNLRISVSLYDPAHENLIEAVPIALEVVE